MNRIQYFLIISVASLMSACNTGNSSQEDTNESNLIEAPSVMTFQVIKTHAHDTTSYTEGFEWNGDTLIESTGNYKESKLILLDTNMKEIRKPLKLNDEYFGEGTTLFKGKIYQLTYKEHKVFVYDAKTLNKITELYFPFEEAWGMTHNDTAIIVTTGGSNLYYLDPVTFKTIKTVGVYDNNGYVANVNELEYLNGKLFANVYLTDKILQIDPMTGNVLAVADLSNILAQVGVKNDPKKIDAGNVLNGIAYNKQKGTFFITGKMWPVTIELKLNGIR
jgi:glutamine cyclotransferase